MNFLTMSENFRPLVNAEAAKVAEAEAAQENVEVNTSVDALLGDAA